MHYEYKCNKCEHVFDIFCPLSEWDKERACPECGDTPCQKIIGSVMAIPSNKLMGGMKTPEGFKDVLRSIADRTPGGKGIKDAM